MKNLIDSKFDEYEIIGQIGQGSSATVYLAKHRVLGIYRVIKRISKSQTGKNPFYLKSDLILNLNHQCVPTVFEKKQDEKYVYLLEEYCYGETLQSIITKKEAVSIDWRIYKVIQLLSVLSDIHSDAYWGILHLDIKPEHVICQGDQIKLIDFGLAVINRNHTCRHQYGTLDYVAPEVAEYGKVSIQADIYSVGRLLENLLYADDTDVLLIAGIRRIAAIATSEKPEARFDSADAFKQAIMEERSRQRRRLPRLKHPVRSILILGSRRGIGTTHIAIGLTCTLNSMGITSAYQANSCDRWLVQLMKEHENFLGLPRFGAGIVDPGLQHTISVHDGGNLEEFLFEGLESLHDYELVILIISGRLWEQEQSLSAVKHLKGVEHIRIVCNLTDVTSAKVFAKYLGRKVYCYPMEMNPYVVTTKKEELARALLDIRR